MGSFEPGRLFDAVLLDLQTPSNPLNEFIEHGNWEELLGNVVYNTQACNIDTVWVSGQQVSKLIQ